MLMARFGCNELLRCVSYPDSSNKLFINSKFRYTPINWYKYNQGITMAYGYNQITVSTNYSSLINTITLTWFNQAEDTQISLTCKLNRIKFEYQRARRLNKINYLLYVEMNGINMTSSTLFDDCISLFRPIRRLKANNVFTLFNQILAIALRFNDAMMLQAIKDGDAQVIGYSEEEQEEQEEQQEDEEQEEQENY